MCGLFLCHWRTRVDGEEEGASSRSSGRKGNKKHKNDIPLGTIRRRSMDAPQIPHAVRHDPAMLAPQVDRHTSSH